MSCCSQSPQPSLWLFLLYFPAFLADRSSKINPHLCQGQYSSVWGEWRLQFGSIVFNSGATQTRSRGRAHFTHRASGKPEIPWMCQPCATNPGGISVAMNYSQLSFQCRSWSMPAPGWARCARSCSLSPSQTQLGTEPNSTPNLLVWWPNSGKE